MQIGSSFSPVTASYGAPQKTSIGAAADPLMQLAPSDSDTTESTLMKFLKMSPAEKMQYTWLNSHHLTKEKLAAMSPEERQAIQQQIAKELQEQALEARKDRKGQDEPGKSVDISV